MTANCLLSRPRLRSVWSKVSTASTVDDGFFLLNTGVEVAVFLGSTRRLVLMSMVVVMLAFSGRFFLDERPIPFGIFAVPIGILLSEHVSSLRL